MVISFPGSKGAQSETDKMVIPRARFESVYIGREKRSSHDK